MPLLEAKKISKTYYSDGVETPVLFDLSFSVEEGELVAITGPSGSGKSTLLHIAGFLDEPTGGKFCFNDKCMMDYTDEEIAKIRNREMGFVFQAFNLLPRTSVYDNVKLPLLYSDIPEKEWEKLIWDAIKAVELEHRAEHLSHQLSGGEKQRVAIARSLVCKPKVIFADEPTGNLDTKTEMKIMDILRDLNEKEGHTIIIITHDPVVASYAHRNIHIIDGRIHSDRKTRKRKKSKHVPDSDPGNK